MTRYFLAALATVLLLFAPCLARAKVKTKNLEKLRPGQPNVGVSISDFKAEEWEKAAAARGLTLEEYAREVLKPKAHKRIVPGLLDPKGKVHPRDAHHRGRAQLRVQRLTGVQLPLKIRPVVSYVNRRKAFERDFPGGLPRHFDDLEDDPMRSLIGFVFKKAELKGSHFADYVQFKVAERLLQRGLMTHLKERSLVPQDATGIPPGRPSDALIEAVHEFAFKDPGTVKFLRKQALPEHRASVDAKVETAVASVSSAAAPHTVLAAAPRVVTRRAPPVNPAGAKPTAAARVVPHHVPR